MSNAPHRRPLTNAILAHLRSGLSGKEIPVGDGVIPQGAAWHGEPNSPGAYFQPYSVLISGTANQSSGPIGDAQSSWKFPYMVGTYNVSRDSLELVADMTRDLLSGLRGEVYSMGVDSYKVIYVRYESIGSTNRVDQADPPFWGQTDSLTMWMEKVL